MNHTTRLILAVTILLPGISLAQVGGTPPVDLSEARMTTMAPTMQVAGTVVSRSDAFLSAEVDGRLIEVADIGSRVDAGDVVARIEDTSLKLRARELESEITRAEARLNFLEAELRRFERLAETNLAALSQIEQTRSERDVAGSDLAVVRARLDQVEDQIERTRITAPFPGVVAERAAQAGERVAAGTRVVRMVNPDSLEVVARAPLSYYRFVQPGDELAITVAGEILHAPLRTTVSVGGEARHVFELRLDLDAALPVGQTVRVTVPTADVREVLAVPRDALVLRGDGIAVFIVDEDNKARRIRVTTGIGEGEWIEVRGSIREGDRVVIRGNERLRAGQEVSVRES
ncbi:efflux RND transporter periplasmic adaptor subunit [Wenzhouxiangella sp. AB-CW3]|uniref:efflux RND transporter periplasmic adaptor subunit n=1 Tax=Wenzhouxiangella sp. AB-CW3 TaxID=2771012 RepID=UPI00168AD83A|nr:efflux RND transporter periplasmic adaptor subunit [Wenzhouxiangella sp. AB-CW3]QOC22326.1 efflux RND transporter periplasmic adaptor subunit [Wenzhouxiangella sp. AB-CW3]